MDLLEYQAKELFREIGIPVLPSQSIQHPTDLKGLQIPYPVVLKSQVRRGSRGKAGGIRFVENTIDAVAAAQSIFNLPIVGEYPKVLLAETRYDTAREFYLAVILDATVRRPVLLGSTQGGIKAKTTIEQLHRVVVEHKFSPFYARQLAIKMGVTGTLIPSVSAVIEKMYQLFVQKDLDLVEINPLGISPRGELMALDGRISINESALSRHSDLSSLVATLNPKGCPPLAEAPGIFEPVELKGNIGLLCNGLGLTLATLDLIYQAKGQPACFLNVAGETHHAWAASALSVNPEAPVIGTLGLRWQLQQGIDRILQNRTVKVLLINLLAGFWDGDEVAQVVEAYVKRIEGRRSSLQVPWMVVRLLGQGWEEAQARLAPLSIVVTPHLEDAVTKAVALAKE